MRLPNLSNSMDVARLRFIQSIHEYADRRNPDTLVRRFIPLLERWRCRRLSAERLGKFRSDPFYYYLIARTKYYDELFVNASSREMRQIINVGCGSDTRAYRFARILNNKGVRVLECDQPSAIFAKQRMLKNLRRLSQVEHLPIDLNDNKWQDFDRWLGERVAVKTVVIMEGVSPYVDDSTFSRFLEFLANRVLPGSTVAYDFKVRGINDTFGNVGSTQRLFRLPRTREEVAAFHKTYGYRLDHLELSSELCARLLPGLSESNIPLFNEDALIQLQVGGV